MPNRQYIIELVDNMKSMSIPVCFDLFYWLMVHFLCVLLCDTTLLPSLLLALNLTCLSVALSTLLLVQFNNDIGLCTQVFSCIVAFSHLDVPVGVPFWIT